MQAFFNAYLIIFTLTQTEGTKRLDPILTMCAIQQMTVLTHCKLTYICHSDILSREKSTFCDSVTFLKVRP